MTLDVLTAAKAAQPGAKNEYDERYDDETRCVRDECSGSHASSSTGIHALPLANEGLWEDVAHPLIRRDTDVYHLRLGADGTKSEDAVGDVCRRRCHVLRLRDRPCRTSSVAVVWLRHISRGNRQCLRRI